MSTPTCLMVSLRRWTLRVSIALLAIMVLVGCDRDDDDGDDDSQQEQEELAVDEEDEDDEDEGDEDGAFGDLSDLFDGATLASQEDAEEWASTSPPSVFFISYFSPILSMLGFDEDESDCPDVAESDDGAMEITTDCVDDEGREWSGSANSSAPESEHDIVFGGLPGASTMSVSRLELNDLRFAGPKACISDPSVEEEVDVRYDGFVDHQEVGDNQYAFEVDLVIDGIDLDGETCELEEGKTVIQYQGEYELLEFNDDDEAVGHQWSGEGAMGQEAVGWVQLMTEDQHFDLEACEHKPASGHTVVSSEGTELEYRYDGAENCDEEATVTWYLDGEEQGTVEGVNCSAVGGTTGVVSILSVLLVLGLLRRESNSQPVRSAA